MKQNTISNDTIILDQVFILRTLSMILVVFVACLHAMYSTGLKVWWVTKRIQLVHI